jgi:hypothetical protein
MPLLPLNSVGGYSTGITATSVIDVLGNITGVGATFSGLIRANAGISSAGGTFTALTRFTAGISASGGMTLAGGTFNLDANIDLKRPSNSTTTIQAYYSPAPGSYSPTSYISLSPTNGITFGGGLVNVPGYLNVDTTSLSVTSGTVPLTVKGSVTPFPQFANMTDWINGSGTILSSILVGGGFSGPASNFSGLLTANAGISSAGATFTSTVTVDGSNVLNAGNIQTSKAALEIDTARSTSRVAIGDINGFGNGNYIYLRNATNELNLVSPYGEIKLGDIDGVDTANYIYYYAAESRLSSALGTDNITNFANISATNGFYETANQIRVTNNARSWFL